MPAYGPAGPIFWSNPLRYIRWSSRERPALFWSVIIGASGPISIPIILKVRKMVGDENAALVPMTYPVPTGPRKQLTGYDDDTEK